MICVKRIAFAVAALVLVFPALAQGQQDVQETEEAVGSPEMATEAPSSADEPADVRLRADDRPPVAPRRFPMREWTEDETAGPRRWGPRDGRGEGWGQGFDRMPRPESDERNGQDVPRRDPRDGRWEDFGPGYGWGPRDGRGPGYGYGRGPRDGRGPGYGYGRGPQDGRGPGYGYGPRGGRGPGYGRGQGYGPGPGYGRGGGCPYCRSW